MRCYLVGIVGREINHWQGGEEIIGVAQKNPGTKTGKPKIVFTMPKGM